MSVKSELKIVAPEADDRESDLPLNSPPGIDAVLETEFDAHLPPELREMARQLSDDANFLATRSVSRSMIGSTAMGTPTSAGEEPLQRSVPASQTKVWRHVAAAVFLVGLGACGAVFVTRLWPNLARTNKSEMPIAVANAPIDSSTGNHETSLPSSILAANAQNTRVNSDVAQEARNFAGVQEVGFGLSEREHTNFSETEMLRIQVTAFEQVIRRLQVRLEDREKSEAETQRLVESLRAQVGELRRQLDEREKNRNSP